MKIKLNYIVAFLLAAIGLLSLFLTLSILLDLFNIRAKEGHYVLTIVWANFICSIIYLISAYGFINEKKWTYMLLGIATLILISAFILFGIHIYLGKIYETKTIGAMIFRILITVTFGVIAYYKMNRNRITN